MDKINQIADNLALTGKPVDDDELVNIILNNVGPSYEVTVNSEQARGIFISYDDFVTLLLNAEMRLKVQQTPSLEASPTAMYAPLKLHKATTVVVILCTTVDLICEAGDHLVFVEIKIGPNHNQVQCLLVTLVLCLHVLHVKSVILVGTVPLIVINV